MKRKGIHQGRHPFNKHPFEALFHGSWQSVDRIEIKDGATTLHYADNNLGIEEKGPSTDIRVKSRAATVLDCSCLLRPGIDVCVLSPSSYTEGSEEGNLEPVWLDAKISSIERNPHEPECSCQFFINIYENQGSLGSEIKGPLRKETEVIGLNQISILQTLPRAPCEGQFYRWDLSEDCSSRQRTKVFLGRFLSDLTWLLVASVMKQIAFDVTSVGNKIIYQVLGVDDDLPSLTSDSSLRSVSFTVENDSLNPTIIQFVPDDDSETSTCDAPDSGLKSSYDVFSIRRSKRRNLQPERLAPPLTEYGLIRALPYTPLKWKEEAEILSLPGIFPSPEDLSYSEEQAVSEKEIGASEEEPLGDVSVLKTRTKSREVKTGVGKKRRLQDQLAIVPVLTEADQVSSKQLHSAAKTPGKCSEESTHEELNSDSKQCRSSGTITSEQLSAPAKTPKKFPGRIISKKSGCSAKNPQKFSGKIISEQSSEAGNIIPKQSGGPAKVPRKCSSKIISEPSRSPAKIISEPSSSPAKIIPEPSSSPAKIISEQASSPAKIISEQSSSPAKIPQKNSGKIISEQSSGPAKIRRKNSNKTNSDKSSCPARTTRKYTRKRHAISSGHHRSTSAAASQKKTDVDLEDMVLESAWEGKASVQNVKSVSYGKKIVQGGRYRPFRPRRNGLSESVTSYKRASFCEGMYSNVISSYMKNINSTLKSKEGEEPHIIDHWKEFKAKSCMEQQQQKMEPPATEVAEKSSELEALWREMELCLASACLFGGAEARVPAQTAKPLTDLCEHIFKLDEEIGVLCSRCGFVKTEIRYVTAPFKENTGWKVGDRAHNNHNSKLKPDEDEDLALSCHPAINQEAPLLENTDTVWDLIPEVRMKLHAHQKKAFEFLWTNIAGSMVPELMEEESKKVGGCVISHTPGAGKTFLIIAFLISYLKLFPGKRPLVLAPKTTLYTWYKEFIKWEIPIPVHLLHGRRTYRVFRQRAGTVGKGVVQNEDVMHILDSLEKIQKWHAQPSVLVMGYSSFLTLMRENSRFPYRKYMAKVLRESPGILILDEGHNPRSTKSRLRKALMKVETDIRVLLSGTLFQNNFCEYFNTLCLARPKFVKEVLQELDPRFKRKNKGVKKIVHLSESRARKFFMDNISDRIDSNITAERMRGINMLRKLTNSFIDVYEGGSSDMLPGLQIYTIMMNSTNVQHELLVKLQRIMETYDGYPLELELLITLAAIHPWLVRTSVCVNKFCNPEELMRVEKLKSDAKMGSKVMFVLNLVYRVVHKEKVLMFCHNIAPIHLFLELFETVFNWQRGREVLILTGDQELFERGRIMDQFEESSTSRVLLASITACAEGVSLTAASRVIMLDSEWNPSKTRQAIARAFRPGQQKMVYVYQLLATGTIEEDKYRRTTWKEWVSSMIFSETFGEDPSRWRAEKIEDDILREMVEEDRVKSVKSFNKIMKNEKASTGSKTT